MVERKCGREKLGRKLAGRLVWTVRRDDFSLDHHCDLKSTFQKECLEKRLYSESSFLASID